MHEKPEESSENKPKYNHGEIAKIAQIDSMSD